MPSMRLDRLREQREAAGFTIARLATASLTSDQTINTLEQLPIGGTVEERDPTRIAAALGLSLDDLGSMVL